MEDLAGDAVAAAEAADLHAERVTREVCEGAHAGGVETGLEALRAGDQLGREVRGGHGSSVPQAVIRGCGRKARMIKRRVG